MFLNILSTVLLGILGVLEIISVAGKNTSIIKFLSVIGITCALPIVAIWMPSILWLNIVATSVLGIFLLLFIAYIIVRDENSFVTVGGIIFVFILYGFPILAIWL